MKSSSFTLFELVIVIVVLGILVIAFNPSIYTNKLQLAADQVVKHILYTESLALRDDKYQPFAIDTSSIEQNRSKYWFKQFWQIRFSVNDNNEYWYEVFSDSPTSSTSTNFDRRATLVSEFAKDIDGKYIVGNCSEVDCNKVVSMNVLGNSIPVANLTKAYEINKIEILNCDYGSKYCSLNKTYSFKLLFDNFGNVFLNEGEAGDSGDINIFQRQLLTHNITLRLCKDASCNEYKDILITPKGDVELIN